MISRRRLLSLSVLSLVHAACGLALLGLLLLACSILLPGPLPIVLGMSLGHPLGAAAFCLYLLAVVLDVRAKTLPRPGKGD